ncbi:response regulator [Kangiella marina]|uniref:Response regulatory domain-containing protein n=1 Tax=Kangiella marina TaxID=1079178 RepID=A0ABP8ICB7_9GAMM
MKKTKLTHQYSFAYAIAFAVVLIVVNFVFYRSLEDTHKIQQKKLCDLIIASFTPGIEYGLSFGNTSDLQHTLYPLRNNPEIALIQIIDNQGTVVSQVDNRGLIGMSQNIDLPTVDKDISQTLSSGVQGSFSEQLIQSAQNEKRRLGQLKIATTPYRYSRAYDGITHLFINLAIILPLALFWLFLKVRQNQQSKVVRKITAQLNNPESYKDFKENLRTAEGTDLLTAVENQVIKTQGLRHKLNMLKTEVQKARLDANTELHEFIGFITQQDFNSSINNLMMFYEIIKRPIDQTRAAVWCRDLLSQSVVELSSEAKNRNTLIQESFSGNRMNHQVHVDQKAFKQMLRLLLQQLITICEGETLNIHFDLRQDYQDIANLRISFSSEAELFKKALERQSLFQFIEELPVTVHSNNIQLISAKHLLKKFGGEYLYFSDEIRFEMPLNTLSQTDKKSQPEPIVPLGINLSVLVYDSDPIDKMVLIGYLTKLGVTVDKATTKQVVVQKLRHDSYDAIIVNSDFLSDDASFALNNFLEEIEQLETKPDVIIVSHDHSVIETEAFGKLGSAQFITKPVDPRKLGKTLSSL